MIKLTMLGTSGSTPTKERGLPSMLVSYEGNSYLFDCGEGTQMQMMKFKTNISKVKCIFLTHLHGDHVIGIAGLIRTMALNNREGELVVFIPKGYESKLSNLLTFDRALIRYKVTIKGVGSGEVYKGKDFTVRAFKLNHTIATFGYSFAENDRFKFDKERCKSLGIRGKMFSELSDKGRVRVKGKTIMLKQAARRVAGKKIVYASDSRPCASTIAAARNCTVLVHEANYANEQQKLAQERKHSTAQEAAKVAKSAKAGMLILTHISARYRDAGALLKEAQGEFKNSVLGYDGYTIDI